MAKWCFDAGHGGYDPGAVGINGTREKDIVLQAALRAKAIMEANGETVVMTRTSDVFISLSERVNIANNNNCDYFVSFHMNSSSSSSSIGTEVWISKGASSNSGKLAGVILGEMYNGINNNFGYNSPNRGIKSENFYVIRYTFMPAWLVEGDFISNGTVENSFNANSYGEFVAKGCLAFIGKTKGETIPAISKDFSNGNTSTSSKRKTSLSPSSYSEWVARLQRELNYQGFTDAYGRKLRVDGYVGPNTLAACKKTPIYYGIRGNITKLLQEMLVNLGYDVNGIDGICGKGMVAGIKNYQRDWSLAVDGSFGPNSWTSILGL